MSENITKPQIEPIVRLQNEYLIIIDKDSSKALFIFCKTQERFNEYLLDNSKLKINDGNIIYENKQYKYLLKNGNVKGKNQRFFYVTVYFDGDDEGISAYKFLHCCPVKGIKKQA